jgi:hypothetical protein
MFGAEYDPAAQSGQCQAATVAEYLPLGQPSHRELAKVAEKSPGVHWSHVDAPISGLM